MVFRAVGFQVVENRDDLGRTCIFRTKSVSAADDQRLLRSLPVKCLADVEIKRLTGSAGLFCAVQYRDFPYRFRYDIQEMFFREWPVEPDSYGACPAPAGIEVVHRLIDSIAYRAHCYDHVFRVRSAVIIEKPVASPGDALDFLHVSFDYGRNIVVEPVCRFPSLEVDVRVLCSSPCNGMLRIQRPCPEILHGLHIDDLCQVRVVYQAYLLVFVRSPETVEKVDERYP